VAGLAILAAAPSLRPPARTALLGGVWLGALAALLPQSAHALDGMWTGPGAEWTTGTNWSSSPTVPDNTATFTGSAPTSVTISNNASINTIDFDAAAPAYSFGVQTGATFTINNAINNASSFAPAFSVNTGATLAIGDTGQVEIGSLSNGTSGGGTVQIGSSDPSTNLFVTGTASTNTVFSGSFSGAGSFELDGGTLTLNGANMGTIGGNLIVDNCSCSTSNLTISGGSLTVNGTGGFGNGVSVFAGTLTVNNGATVQIGSTSLPSDLFVADTMTISGAGTSVTVSGATGVVGFFPTAAVSLTISNGARLDSQSGAEIDSIFGPATATVTGAGSRWDVGGMGLSVGGGSTGGPGALTISNGGVVNTNITIIGDNVDGSSTVLVTGTGSQLNATTGLSIGDTGCVCGTLVGTLTIADGGLVNSVDTRIFAGSTLNLGAGGLGGTIITPTIVNDGQIVANFTDTITLAADISGAGTLSKAGTGTLILTGNNSYAGGTTITGGFINFNSANSFGTGPIAIDGGGLQWATGNTADISAQLAAFGAGGATFDTNGNNVTLASSLSGVGGVTKTGAGTMTLAGVNTYQGGTTINGGVLAVSSNANLGAAAGGLTFNGGTLRFLAGFSTDRTITLNAGGGTFDTNANDATLTGAIGGVGGLTKTGTGTMTLAGVNTYQGGTTINGGALAVSSNANLGAAAGGLTFNGGTLRFLAGFSTDRTITLNAGGGTFDTNANNATLTGTIGSVGGLTKTGAGTLILTGSNNYAGGTTVSGGTLQLGDAGNIGKIVGSIFNQGIVNVINADTSAITTIENLNGSVNFFNTSSAGSATISAVGPGFSVVSFNNASTAGTARIFNSTVVFNDTSTAGNATINTGEFVIFNNAGTAGTASITANFINFNDASSAENSVIHSVGGLAFANASTAGNATITNDGAATFSATSTAANANITNNFSLRFQDSSTAGNATIITNNGGTTAFGANSTGGSARLITNAGGAVDISGLTTAGLTLGSIEGAGNYRLGSKSLTVGSNNLSTEVSGSIQDGGDAGGTGGSLVKVGSGTLTLSGVNTYSSGTILAGGTLRLANNQALGTGALTATGSVVDYANGVTIANAIVVNSNTTQLSVTNGSATQAGAISELNGPRPLEKIGAGALVLSGINTYSGPTTISGGALIVTGSIANSAVTVNAGAVLAGTGTVGATTINSGGTFAPGSGTPGTMAVQGNLAFQSGAIYLMQVTPSLASSANVIAGGTAALAGTVNASFAPGSYVTRTYTILSAAGGLNGSTFNALTTTNLPAGFTANLGYSASDVILNLTANLGGGPSALGTSGLSINQKNVANSLNNFFNRGGALPPNFVSIFGLTGGNLGNALSQLSGEPATGAQQAAFQMGNQFLNLMLDPFVDGRSSVAGAGGPALGFAPEQEALPDDIALAYSKVFKAPAMPAATFEQRWSAWGGAYGGGNKTSGDPAVLGSHDLTANTAGFAAGLDYRLSPNSVMGIALAGGGANWSLSQGLGGGKSDAFQAGVYGATRWGAAYLAGAFAFTNHWMSTDRFAFAGDHLTASFNAQSYGGRVEGGYRVATFYGGITPYAAIQAQSFRTPGYSEIDGSGGGFALSYNARTGNDTRSELGARFDRLIALYPGAALSLRGRLAWAHDWVNDPSLAAVFQTLPGASFIVNGALPAKDSALASAGVEYRLANGLTLLGKFDGEFASRSSTYAGTGTVRYSW
jgi:autotransporter-associated beta strand protein